MINNQDCAQYPFVSGRWQAVAPASRRPCLSYRRHPAAFSQGNPVVAISQREAFDFDIVFSYTALINNPSGSPLEQFNHPEERKNMSLDKLADDLGEMADRAQSLNGSHNMRLTHHDDGSVEAEMQIKGFVLHASGKDRDEAVANLTRRAAEYALRGQ